MKAPATDSDGASEGEVVGEDTAAAGVDPEATVPAAAVPPLVDVPPVVMQEPDPPAPVAVDVTAHKATVDALDGKIETLQQQYDDGDLTAAEWREQLNTLVKEQAAAQAALTTAEAQMAEMAPKAEAYRDAWFSKVTAYQEQHAYLQEPEHYDNWDASLRMVNTNAAYANLTMAQRIEQAHRIYDAHYQGLEGKPLPTRPGMTTAQKKAEAEKPAIPDPRTDPRPEAPTTLAGLTNAGDNGIEDGRFAQIDRIADTDPLAAERMVASLSDADRAAYLNV
jgi:hypothetical protein